MGRNNSKKKVIGDTGNITSSRAKDASSLHGRQQLVLGISDEFQAEIQKKSTSPWTLVSGWSSHKLKITLVDSSSAHGPEVHSKECGSS